MSAVLMVDHGGGRGKAGWVGVGSSGFFINVMKVSSSPVNARFSWSCLSGGVLSAR
jgi:hypothetical protein